MILSPEISLEEYHISPDSGFLPDGLPLSQLTHPYYAPWEKLASQLPTLIKTGQIRPLIDSLPVLDTTWLLSEPEWRRAYSILGFLTHAYVWGGQKPQDVSIFIGHRHLETPSVLTYIRISDPPTMHLKTFPQNLHTPGSSSLRNIRGSHPLELHRTRTGRHHRTRQRLPPNLLHGHQRRRMVHGHLRRYRGERCSPCPAHARRDSGSCFPRLGTPNGSAVQIYGWSARSQCYVEEDA